jgi:hypothetical protein
MDFATGRVSAQSARLARESTIAVLDIDSTLSTSGKVIRETARDGTP